MKCNVGKIEKIIRIVIGIGGVALGIFISPWWFILAGVMLATAAMSFCPLTKLMGINTCKNK